MNQIPFHIRIQIALVILCIAEAWLETIVIKMKNPASGDYVKLNKQEHNRSAVYYAALIAMLCIVSWDHIIAMHLQGLLLILTLLLQRRIFFEYALKLFRGRQIRLIEGDQYWDLLSRKLFGYKGGWKELGVLIVLTITTNFFM
jgi:hypothetical protein